MPEQTQKLDIAGVEEIVGRLVKTEPAFVGLCDDDKKRVTIGTSVRNDVARCMAYVPAERPELGKIIVVYDINRSTGGVTKIPESDW